MMNGVKQEVGSPPSTWWERIANLSSKQSELEARVVNLEEYQNKQNGSINRVEARLEEFRTRVEERLGRIQWWLIGLLGSAVVSLILLVISLFTKA